MALFLESQLSNSVQIASETDILIEAIQLTEELDSITISLFHEDFVLHESDASKSDKDSFMRRSVEKLREYYHRFKMFVFRVLDKVWSMIKYVFQRIRYSWKTLKVNKSAIDAFETHLSAVREASNNLKKLITLSYKDGDEFEKLYSVAEAEYKKKTEEASNKAKKPSGATDINAGKFVATFEREIDNSNNVLREVKHTIGNLDAQIESAYKGEASDRIAKYKKQIRRLSLCVTFGNSFISGSLHVVINQMHGHKDAVKG